MRLASLGSGSSGNSTLIESDQTLVLVDCGFGLKETEKRMARLGVEPSRVAAIVVTHEHTDHSKGVGPFARKYGTPVYMTEGTFVSKDYGVISDLKIVRDGTLFTTGDIVVEPVAVPHDAREPVQYTLSCGDVKWGVLTDLGSITSYVVDVFRECDGILVEANHDLMMLANGPYPPSLRARVSSAWGHLNNGQTAQLLEKLSGPRLKSVVVGHISRKNNSLECARAALSHLEEEFQTMHYVCQDDGLDWVEIPNGAR